MRDLGRASELVQKALRLDPKNLAHRGDLGMVLYRQARYPESVATLEPAIDAHPEAVDRARWRIFLAMGQHRLGQSRAALESYHRGTVRARRCTQLSRPTAEEFARLWAEADATIQEVDGR